MQLWDPGTGTLIRELVGHTDGVGSVAFGLVSGRTVLAIGSGDRTVRLWTRTPGPSSTNWSGTPAGGCTVLATGSTDRTVRLWDPGTGVEVAVLPRRSSPNAIAFRPGTAWLAIGDEEGVAVLDLDCSHPAGR